MSRKKNIVQELMQAPEQEVSGTFAKLVFPTDRWGLTTELKLSSRDIAARISGSEDKYTLVVDTLKLLLRHIETRYNEDKAKREAASAD